MHEKNSSSSDHNPKPKGFYLSHYPDSKLPSAMKYPDPKDILPNDLPDLGSMQPIGELLPSSPEAVRLVQAINTAPGCLPQTPNGTLLESLAGPDFDGHETWLASTKTHDEDSNGILYLQCNKFIHVGDLKDLVNGRSSLKNGRSSKDVITKYTNMPYETMPPVQQVIAYYEEPSGNTYYSLVNDGAHRVAAAYQRGDNEYQDGNRYVPATSVSFVRLDTNAISERLEKIPRQEEELKRRFGSSILKRLGVRKPR